MSAFRKLLIAAALVGAGLGVALLLGDPVAIKKVLVPGQHRSPRSVAAAVPTERAPVGTWASNSARLMPESNLASASTATAIDSPALLSESHLASISTVDMARISELNTQLVNSMSGTTSATTRCDDPAPRAKLRNEAPRPIGNEPRSPATIRRTPAVDTEIKQTASKGELYKAGADWSGSHLVPVGFAGDGNKATAATNAAYDVPPKSADNTQVAPPPWLAAEEQAGSRAHVVVDGDSLQKLAGRYLDDPHRSAEIFELNREVLSNPDLLPIGAELKIPDRTAQNSWGRQGRRTGLPIVAPVREAAHGNLVPVRPISMDDTIVPRAQLARPQAVE